MATVAVALVLVWPSLQYPWYWDDYHLIRTFNLSELGRAFTGHWDVDNIETVGYRPLTTVLNHVRAALFGESVVAHRLFLAGTLAVFVSFACYIVHRLGLRLIYAICAAILSVATVSNTNNLIWIADGVHQVAGIPVLTAGLVALGSRFTWRQALATFLLALLGLLVREDMAALFPFVVGVAFLAENPQLRPMAPRIPLSRAMLRGMSFARAVDMTSALAAAVVTYSLLRAYFVPSEVGFEIGGFVNHLFWTFLPAGAMVSPVLWAGFLFAALALIAASFAVTGLSSNATLSLILAASMILGCTPGFVMGRPNLLLVPATMFALLLAVCSQTIIMRWAAPPVKILLAGLWLALTLVSFRESRITQDVLHPLSFRTLINAYDMTFGESHDKGAVLPPERRAQTEQYLAQFGIEAEGDSPIFWGLVEEAKKAGRTTPKEGGVFLPRSGELPKLNEYPSLWPLPILQ